MKTLSRSTFKVLNFSTFNLARFLSSLLSSPFQRTMEPEIRRMFHKKIEFYNKTLGSLDYNYFTPEQGVELMRTQAFGFHVEEATAYKIIQETFDEKLICKLSEIEVNRPVYTVGNVRKNSPFRELYTFG
jgi:hypothetical protein